MSRRTAGPPVGTQAYIVMAYIVVAYIVVAYIVMAYIVVAYIVMASRSSNTEPYRASTAFAVCTMCMRYSSSSAARTYEGQNYIGP